MREVPREAVDAGSRCRRRRPGTRRARAAARARARDTRRASGFGRSRGRYGVTLGMPITIASSGSSSSARRSSTARSSASACATDGGPPNAPRPSAPCAASAARRGAAAPAARRRRGAAASARSARAPPGRTGSRAARRENCGWLSTSDTPSSGTRCASARSSASARCQPCDAVVSSSEYAPAARSASAPHAASSAAGPPCSTDSAALTTMTRSVSTSARLTRSGGRDDSSTSDELGILDVVDDDVAVEAPRELRRDERLELALRRCGARARGATRNVWYPVEMPSRSSSSTTAETACCRGSFGAPGIGSAGGSTTIVARAPRRASASSPSPSSGKRSASRTAAPTSATAVAGRRRPQHDRVVGRGGDDEPRAGEQRDAEH